MTRCSLTENCQTATAFDWLRRRRSDGWLVPALILTAEMDSVDDRVEGLNAGADDYILKPVNMDELIARLRAVLRRPPDALDPVLRAGNIEFDSASRQVWIDGKSLKMPRREISLLEVFMRRPERVVPRIVLEESLFSYDDEVSSNALEVGIYRLRHHLTKAQASVVIRTDRGLGYALEVASGPVSYVEKPSEAAPANPSSFGAGHTILDVQPSSTKRRE